MQRFTMICGALVLMSLTCVAQTRPTKQGNPTKEQIEEKRKEMIRNLNASLAADETRYAIIRDLIDTEEECQKVIESRVDNGACVKWEAKMGQIPLDVFAPFLPPVKPSGDELVAIKYAIFRNIWASYKYGKEKAAK